MSELAELIAERAAKMFAVRGIERAVAEAVIRAFKRDDAALAGGKRGGLERGFDCLETRAAEDDFSRVPIADCRLPILFCPALESNLAQLARELRFECVWMHVAHRVQKFRHLFLSGADDGLVRVTGGGDAERGGEIQILFTFRIPDVNAAGAFPDNRPRAVGFGEQHVARFVGAERGDGFLGFHFFTTDAHGCTRMEKVRSDE